MLKNTNPTLRKFKIATYNKMLHNNSICPANHEINYYNSWYYFDEKPEQRPNITRKAKENMKNPNITVKFNELWNTYVLKDLPHESY